MGKGFSYSPAQLSPIDFLLKMCYGSSTNSSGRANVLLRTPVVLITTV